MGETDVPEGPKKIHGNKLAEAFRQRKDVGELSRHSAEEMKRSRDEEGGWVSGGRRRLRRVLTAGDGGYGEPAGPSTSAGS